MSKQREQGWYCVKFGGEWGPAYYHNTPEEILGWYLCDVKVAESDFEQIGPRIRMPDETAPKPYGWACENRSPSGVLLGVRFVAGEIPTGRNRTEHWFPLWRYADLEMLVTRPTITIEGQTASEIAQQLRDAERLVARERTIAKQAMVYDELELALSVAGSSIHDHLSPADALNWLIGYHRANARADLIAPSIGSMLTASQEQAVDTYGSREHECGSDT